uniref:Uncharacterized protein n=1 Tax=Paramoeba aestuarina TaxID=180227 RepID=A0A7S4KIL0_9EUKA|mmetsp:Transcript_1959/g.3024  ORF Transcript_1959/g.3024 Transcript_1959/m.3024 type:complete len:192 (+) Transcript_1959:597-1172(+)
MQNKINLLTHKVEVAHRDLENEKEGFLELQEKYAEQVRQKRKLEELYQKSKDQVGSTTPRRAAFSPTPGGACASSGSKSPLPFRPVSMRPPEDPLRFSSPRPSRFSVDQSRFDFKSALTDPRRKVLNPNRSPLTSRSPIWSPQTTPKADSQFSRPPISMRSPTSPAGGSPAAKRLTRPPFFSTPAVCLIEE